MSIQAYTDGSCSPNPGPGGWGWAYYFDSSITFTANGGSKKTTNNRMEMTALIELLGDLRDILFEEIELHLDTQYVLKSILKGGEGRLIFSNLGPRYTGHLKGWNLAEGTKRNGSPLLNCDLWKKLDQELRWWAQNRQVKMNFHWVRGHSGNLGNELADKLAKAGVPLRE